METVAPSLRSAPALHVADFRPPGAPLPWFLLNREDAERAGDRLAAAVRSLPPSSLLSIDLSGVESRASCLAVLLSPPLRLIQSEDGTPQFPDRFLVLQGLGANARDAHLGLGVEGVIAICRGGEGVSLIGKADRVVADTYHFARRHREVTSAIFTEAPFGLKISAANARVAKLHRLGLLRFLCEETLEGGGRRYVYQAVE